MHVFLFMINNSKTKTTNQSYLLLAGSESTMFSDSNIGDPGLLLADTVTKLKKKLITTTVEP